MDRLGGGVCAMYRESSLTTCHLLSMAGYLTRPLYSGSHLSSPPVFVDVVVVDVLVVLVVLVVLILFEDPQKKKQS